MGTRRRSNLRLDGPCRLVMEAKGFDALFPTKLANLADSTAWVLARAASGVRRVGAAASSPSPPRISRASRSVYGHELRAFRSEEEMFHGFRDVLTELRLTQATIALEKNSSTRPSTRSSSPHPPQGHGVSGRLRAPPGFRCSRSPRKSSPGSRRRVADAWPPPRRPSGWLRETEVAGEAEYPMRKAGPWGGAASLKAIEARDVV